MATSGSFQSNNEKYCNLYVEWKVTGQSVANNTSTVQVDVYLKHHALNIPSKTLTINFGGTVKNITTPAINIGSSANTTKLGSATLTAWHNANGTKSLTISVSMPINAVCDSTQWGTITASGSATFNQIARPTTPTLSASTVELGQSVTINMARNLSSLTHTLTYSIGNNTGTIGSSLATSKAWTPAIDLAHQIPKSTSGAVTITCKTYSGSTLIGTKSVTLTVTVPASVVPTVSTPTFSDPTGNATKYGNYVQNQSKLQITVAGAGAYSSTITGFKIEANGSTMTLDAAGSVTTGVLTTVGTNKVKVTVTDSRGRTATYTSGDGQNYVIAYTKPKATITAYRCDSSGNENPDGAYIKATISGSVTALNNKNSKTFKIQYKTASATTYTDALTYNSAYTCSSSKVFAADVDSVYNVRAVATDDFNTSTTVVDVSTSYTIIDFKADGKGIAFGKASTEAGFDVEMATKFRQDVRSTKDVIAGLGESYQCSLIDTNKAIITENLLPYPYMDTTTTTNGITFTDNGDGTITMNGTATADTAFRFKPITLKAGTYTFSVSDSGFDTNYCTMQFADTVNSVWLGFKAETNSSGVRTYTLTEDKTFDYNRILVKSGYTMNNVTWKPMLEVGSVKHTWQPYNLSRKYMNNKIDGVNERINKLQPHAYSIMRSQDIGRVTTTQSTFNTFNSRKITDYGMITITMGASNAEVRKEMTLSRSIFTNNGAYDTTFYLDCFSGSGSTFNQIAVKPVNDTQIVVYKTTSSTIVDHVNIYGIKVDDVAI